MGNSIWLTNEGEVKLTLGGFLKYVEIQTKVASVIPFLLGTLYSVYRYESFNFKNFIMMFISLLAFDMATTAINNYYDYKKALKNGGYNYDVKSAIEEYHIKKSIAKIIIVVLVSIAIIFGILLTLNTNIVVLLIGGISFITGVFYTFGPIPISRMPLGEAFSGIFMGFVITFLSIYIHIYDAGILSLEYKSNILSININILEFIYIFFICLPLICGIANIMLANNICDLEEDINHKRYTLPYYIGKGSALRLFRVLYYIGYVDLLILVILRIAPITVLLVLLTFVVVNKNINIFCSNPYKGKNFVLSVKNFVIINLSYIILTALILVVQ